MITSLYVTGIFDSIGNVAANKLEDGMAYHGITIYFGTSREEGYSFWSSLFYEW